MHLKFIGGRWPVRAFGNIFKNLEFPIIIPSYLIDCHWLMKNKRLSEQKHEMQCS